MRYEAALYKGSTLEVMRKFIDQSIDMILADIPYGEVEQKSSGLRKLDRGNADRCEIDLKELVAHYTRLMRKSAYVFCGTEQISTLVSEFKRHGLTTRVGVWEKTNPSPMNGTRLWLSGLEFCVFARKESATFNEHCKKALWQAPSGRAKAHPTEKPVKLMERLVLASSDENDLVLDNTMGIGTTGVACMRTKRYFVGIERDDKYFAIAEQRIDSAVWGSSIDTAVNLPHNAST